MSRILLLYALFLSGNTFAERTVVFGGGDNIDSSQGSIGKNVEFFRSVLENLEREPEVYFGSPNGDHDLYVLDLEKQVDWYQSYNPAIQPWQLFKRTYKNTLDPLGPNTKRQLTDVLHDNPTEDLFFVYSGHGGWHRNDNHLRLFENARFRASEFSVSLNRRTGISRFIFPQCFSGDFAQPIIDYVEKGQGIACGFYSVPRHLEAEGCTPSVDSAEFADYAHNLFLRISNKTQARNWDGELGLSLMDAHLDTLALSHSTDLPFTTSERYLAQQFDWRSRLLSFLPRQSENEYDRVAEVMQKMMPSAHDQDQITKRLKLLSTELATIEKALKATMRNLLTKSSDDHAVRAESFVNEFRTLLSVQKESLDLTRTQNMMTKLAHVKRLANQKRHFDRFASDKQKEVYSTLKSCEQYNFD